MLSRTDLFLLSLLTLLWGVNWPVMKYAVLTYPPLSFRTLTILIAIVALGGYMALIKDRFSIPKDERWRVVKLALLNMVIWHFLTIYGIKFLTSGRAAIIGYTMPIWAMLFGVLVYKAKFTWRSGLGVSLALGATLLLALEEFGSLIGQPVGLVLMLSAAITWGIGTVTMNRTKLSISNASLTFWMMAITFLAMVLASIGFEMKDWRPPTTGEWWAIFYNALLVFCVCHIIWFRLARKLPPIASGLSVMLIPVLGVFSGAWALDEAIGPYDISALILILIAMAVVLLPRRKTPDEAAAGAP